MAPSRWAAGVNFEANLGRSGQVARWLTCDQQGQDCNSRRPPAVSMADLLADAFRRITTSLKRGATLSHMKVGVRELRNQTGQVIDAVRAGELVVLTVHGEPVADIVPHGPRARWLLGDHLRRELAERAADPALQEELASLAGQTLAEL